MSQASASTPSSPAVMRRGVSDCAKCGAGLVMPRDGSRGLICNGCGTHWTGHDLRFPACGQCGYSLSGLGMIVGGVRCPECSAKWPDSLPRPRRAWPGAARVVAMSCLPMLLLLVVAFGADFLATAASHPGVRKWPATRLSAVAFVFAMILALAAPLVLAKLYTPLERREKGPSPWLDRRRLLKKLIQLNWILIVLGVVAARLVSAI